MHAVMVAIICYWAHLALFSHKQANWGNYWGAGVVHELITNNTNYLNWRNKIRMSDL